MTDDRVVDRALIVIIIFRCKILVIGGGTAGCAMAAKFTRRLPKDSVIVLEPMKDHYYQPLFTLAGAGIVTLNQSRRLEENVLPKKAKWIQDFAQCIMPDRNKVMTANGHCIDYEYLIVAAGMNNDYDKVPGLYQALEDKTSGVSSIFAAEYCEKTFSDMQKHKEGNAIFTYPDSLIKCPGAPQKIAYLADSYFNKTGVRTKTAIYYNTCLPVIFGVPKYAKELMKVVKRKHINVNYKTVLKEVRPDKKEAVFFNKEKCEDFVMNYSMLHVTPPMLTPDFLRTNASLVDEHGYLEVDKFTLQSPKYPNIYGIGDCINTPNSKTAAAIAAQSYVLEHNLLATMKKDEPKLKYNGYGACPLFSYHGMVNRCKLLVVGGGAGGCSVAWRFARKLKNCLIVLEPCRVHYYQPGFTLVGAGIKNLQAMYKPLPSVLPHNITWIHDRAEGFCPSENLVVTWNGDKIYYEYMVIAVGIRNDYDKVIGLVQALDNPRCPVSTIYSPMYCSKTWMNIKDFNGGHALFTFPVVGGKCSGAAMKIMFLAQDYWRKQKIIGKTNITYNTGAEDIFGVPKYADAIRALAVSRGIVPNYGADLVEVSPKGAVFMGPCGETICFPYNMLHVTPPMAPQYCLQQCGELSTAAGYLDVNTDTLQHTRYPNVFGLGDCTCTPNSKTAAAVAPQSYVVERNLRNVMSGKAPSAKYNGYGACPLIT
ncbi:hypothetical protein SFRURICE_019092, partial [Spodoptera frugiperda]